MRWIAALFLVAALSTGVYGYYHEQQSPKRPRQARSPRGGSRPGPRPHTPGPLREGTPWAMWSSTWGMP